MTIGTKMVAVFTSPKKAFEAVAEKPDWLAPLILSILIGILVTLVVYPSVIKPLIVEKAMEQMRDQGVPDDRIEEAMDVISGPKMFIITLAQGVITTPILLLILSGILFGAFSLFSGQARFVQVFSAFAYSGLISSLGGIVKGTLMWTQQSIHVGTSLALLLSEDMSKTFLFRLLGHFDLFTLWQLVVLIIGLSVIYKWKASKSAGIVLSLWVLWVLLASLLGGLFRFGVS